MPARPNTLRNVLLVVLIVACALSRLLPHPPNFSPLEATALFAGAYFANRALGMLVPIAAMALSDFVLGWHDGLPLVYACIAAMALAGSFVLRQRRTFARVALSGLGAALFFFFVTNGAIWLSAGTEFCTGSLTACYAAGLPFLKNQLAGVAFYSLLLFGTWRLLERRWSVAQAA
jgi:hypothetical protein